MEFDIERAKDLIAQREQIDAELVAIFGVLPVRPRKLLRCSRCSERGHTARTCPKTE